MKLIRNRGPKPGVALFSVAALALAMTGILYAHWTQTLTADTEVNTGALGVEWSPTGTDDDTLGGNDPSLSDNGLDPSEGGPGAVDRYLVDVGLCVSELVDSQTLSVTATGVYPSYYCTVYADVSNTGTIPVKAAGFGFSVGGAATGFEVTGDGVIYIPNDEAPELLLNITEGIYCGTQLDANESIDVSSWFHVEQDAEQDATYTWEITQTFVNWNEWDASLCTMGSIVADADGDPVGIANGTATPDPLP